MNRNGFMFWLLVLTLVGLVGCSSDPSTNTKKTAPVLHQIQGKAQVLPEVTSADAALNAGGPSVFLWEGVKRYRLFFKTAVEVVDGKKYVAEGVFAQKVIDEIGDPANGKNGYPLLASCERVVKMAWPGLAFDASDGHASVLRAMVKRYPARPVFLVTRLVPGTTKEAAGESIDKNKVPDDEDLPEVSVPADKQRAFLMEGPTVQNAPLWEPAGGTAKCKVIIGKDGKITELETGAQLCEAVPWSQFRYQPPVQKGKPVHVKTEVEVKFEPRK